MADVEDKKELPKRQIAYTMSEIMKKQAEDIRGRLMEYRVVSNRLNPRYNYADLPNHCDILLFGPSGSGKSSLIRTFYHSLYNTRVLPAEITKSIVVKAEKQNEGTTLYSGITLKPSEVRVQSTPVGKIEYTTSAILLHDTRGQIWMDTKEMAQLDLIIQVRKASVREVGPSAEPELRRTAELPIRLPFVGVLEERYTALPHQHSIH
jgi:hypothetical protein